ncbi:MAG: aminopeptidase N [Chloroflexi bacterium]|nr:aminopeptidase N [Chloroflexota bacterium]
MTTEATPVRDILTQDDAEARARRISNPAYVIAVDLQRGADTYRGDVTITFDVSGEGDTFLDFRGKRIDLFEVNGAALAPAWDGYRLTLPGASLTPKTTVRMRYENDYDHEGDGFHQFKDPEDGEEYLYSNFEPYEAHRLFPCFDQPDIKGTYRLTVTAPSEWQVVTNSREVSAAPADAGRTRRDFEETRRFSTYLVALIVGPYHVAREDHHGVPIGLYCRKSLVKHLDTEELFTITRQGLDWFGEFFGVAYPFGKYDQIFVPEFNSGAMENVGAVTHNEYMVFREPPTENQRQTRAETILHEMAHMWFGDLVTMRWFNDLWLNESFATYMSYLCMDSATRFKNSWQNFNSAWKNWAYRADQLVTTHPIAGRVDDTDQTFLNFDGITYGKGAAVLKQLVATIGMHGFREGMREYFRRHAYGNATLADFLAALETGSGRDLKAWARLWLETPSLNTISARWEADGDRITSLTVTQSAPADYPTIRPHTFEVGLIREADRGIHVDVLPVALSGESRELDAARGMERPLMVFPNYNDHAYARVALDEESAAWAKGNIERIDDLLLRQLVWSTLWNMVRDQQFSSIDYLQMVREKLPVEPAFELLDPTLNQALLALSRFVPEERRTDEAHRLFEGIRAALAATSQPDALIIWARALIGCAHEADDLALLGQLADGTEAVPGLTIDQDMRWSIATRFVAFGMPGAAARVEEEARRDPTDRGARAKLTAETSTPTAGAKQAAWERIHGEGYGSLYLTGSAMRGFNWPVQRALLSPYAERFFETVEGIFRTKDKEFTVDYFGALFPAYRVEEAILDRSRKLLARVEDLPTLVRKLREANDELERAIKCRAYAAAKHGGDR